MQGAIANVAQRTPEGFNDPARGDCRWFTLFSSDRTQTDTMSCGVTELAPQGSGLARHRHAEAEVYYVLAGLGRVVIDGVETLVQPGDCVFIPGDAEHGLHNEGADTLRVFYVFPTGSFADVVYRFS